MTIKKQFAPDDTGLDEQMDSLLEVLAELLEEPVAGADNQRSAEVIGDLQSRAERVIHVVVNNQEK
jgi:hypothetical protein